MFRRILLLSTVLVCVMTLLTAPAPSAAAGDLARRYPVIPPLRGGVASQVRALVRTGKRLGNRLNVFSKIGDSITAFPYFLVPVGAGGLQLGGYGNLQDTVNFFMTETARTSNSFANHSLGAREAWTTADLLDPAQADGSVCEAGETPLSCELRVVKPSVALIMIGTNDLVVGDVAGFRSRLTQIIRVVKRAGVVPVLSTIPNRFDPEAVLANVGAYNDVIVQIANNQAIPLWNYWLALDPLPENGVSTDHVHPSVPADGNTAVLDDAHLSYGFPMRNLTALQVLDALRPFLK
ncbi:MAG: SGNH/GDSL hydrolase family protein [Anaerolineae bacterium]|nr:SGNH/GDSL hydrolase family protein [Anaerolineae bacterium]